MITESARSWSSTWAGDDPDRFGDHSVAAGLGVGPVADLQPPRVAAEPLQADGPEAAVLGVGDAPGPAGPAGRHLPDALQVARGVTGPVRLGQRDQPVRRDGIGAGLDDPTQIGLGERPEGDPVAGQGRRWRPGADRPSGRRRSSWPASRPAARRDGTAGSEPSRRTGSRRPRPSAGSPSCRPRPASGSPARRARRRRDHGRGAAPRSSPGVPAPPGAARSRPRRARARAGAGRCCRRTTAGPGPHRRAARSPRRTVHRPPSRTGSCSGRLGPRSRRSRPAGVGTVVHRIVSGSRHCSMIPGMSASRWARSSTPAAGSTRTGTTSGNRPCGGHVSIQADPSAEFTTIAEVTPCASGTVTIRR